MRIDRLEECVVLAETLNYGQAARRLYLSQSVLSRHISDLESELGVQLFVRSRQQVELTPIGEGVIEDAKRVIAAYRRLLSNVEERKSGADETFTAGFLFGVVGDHMINARARLSERRPGVSIRFSTYEVSQLIDALKDDAIDFAIAAVPPDMHEDSFVIRDLFEDSFVLMTPRGHPLSSKEMISPKDLAFQTVALCSQPFFREQNQRISFHLNVAEAVFFEYSVSDIHVLPILLQAENSVAVAPAHIASYFGDQYSFTPIEGLDERVRFAAVWKKQKSNDCFEEFADLIKVEIGRSTLSPRIF